MIPVGEGVEALLHFGMQISWVLYKLILQIELISDNLTEWH